MMEKEKTSYIKTARAASIVSISAVLASLVGFVLQLAMAYYFGAGKETDAFFMAQSTSELLSKLLLGGALASVFLPLFVEQMTRNEKERAWQMALNLFHISAFSFLLLIILVGFFTESFVNFIAPGFSPDVKNLTVLLIRFMLPAFLFTFLSEIAISILHSFKKFSLPALLKLLTPSISVVILLIFVKQIGIFSLALGTLLGSALQFFVLFAAVCKLGMPYKIVFNFRQKDFKRILYLVFPFIFSALATEAAGIVYRILVSDLSAGSLSALKFAEKIFQIISIVFLGTVTTIIFPTLSQKAALKKTEDLRRILSLAFRAIAFFALPITIGLIILAQPTIILFFQRGSFEAKSTEATAIALIYFMLGLLINGWSSVFGHATLAFKATRISVIVTIGSQVVAIVLFYLLVKPLQHAGLALASSLVPLSIIFFYYLYLRKKIPQLLSIFKDVFYIKISVLAVLLGLICWEVKKIIEPYLNYTLQINAFIEIAVITSVGGLIYLLLAQVWKIKEMEIIKAALLPSYKKQLEEKVKKDVKI